MNIHQQIVAEIAAQYEVLREADVISPAVLAHLAFEKFSMGMEEPQIQYASVEHLKQIAREFLRRRKDPDGEESEAYNAQSEMDLGVTFSGQLQDRYPLPRKPGEEPVYKRRHLLTAEERAWNVDQLRKSARARLQHADALEAEGQTQQAA